MYPSQHLYLQNKPGALALAQISFAPTTLAIIITVVLGMAFLAWVIWLLATGRLSKWAKASLQNQKWIAQDNKFNNELKSLARGINEQHAQLGKETWEARISNPGYEDAYNKLVNVNQQVLSMEMHASSLKEELEKFNQDRAKIESKYKEQLNMLDKERETAQAAVNELNKQHKVLDTEFNELSMERARIQREIKEARTNIIEIENSDAPNKSALIFPLNSRLEQLSSALSDVSSKTPAIDEKMAKIETDLNPLNAQLDELGKNYSRTQILMSQDLNPLDDHINKLKQSIKKKEEEIAQLQKSMPTMLEELGAHVDHVRPESLRLEPLYTNLDDLHERTRTATNEQQKLRLEMDKGDKSSVRKFAWFWFAVLLVVIAILAVLFFVK